MNMTVGNTLFKMRVSHLVTYEPGPYKRNVDHCLVKRKQRKFLKDIKVLPSEECITQRKPLVYDLKIIKVKDTRKMFVPRIKIWKLHEDSVNSDFSSYINKYRDSSQKVLLLKVIGTS